MCRSASQRRLAAIGLLLACGGVASAQTVATWTGAGGDGRYNNPLNWNPPVVPINGGGTIYDVHIPLVSGQSTITIDIATPSDIEVNDFVLANNVTLVIGPNRRFSVLDDAVIDGIVDARGANTHFDPGSAISYGNRARFRAREQAVVEVNGLSYTPSGINGHETLMLADLFGVIDASSLVALNFGADGGRWTHSITASLGGIIDLSGLQTIATVPGKDDILSFNVSGAGSAILLDGLSSIVAQGNGNERVVFNVGAGSSISLPSLVSAQRMELTLGSNASFNAPNLATLQYSLLSLNAGPAVTLGQLSDIYNSRILIGAGRTFSGVTDTSYQWDYGNVLGSTTIFSADGAGAVLDLSSLESITHGSGSGNWNDTIQAVNGGVVDLSGLRTITIGRSGDDDDLNLTVNSGGQINLDALETVVAGTHGGERIRFNVGADTTLDMPSLESLTRAEFSLGSNATINAANLSELRFSTLTAQAGRTYNFAPLGNVYNTRLYAQANATNPTVTATAYQWDYGWHHGSTTIFSADGANAVLDLSSLQSITHGSSGGAWNDTIQAINGGVLDLSGLRTITVGINGQDDDLNLTVNSGGQIDLDALETVVAGTHGGERIRFNVGADTTLDMPSLESLTRAEFSLGSNATINAANLDTLRFSTLTAQAGRTYNFAPLGDIYNTRLYAQTNATNPAVTATSYQWDYGWHFGSTTIFSADGAGAVLDLSSLQSITHGSSGGAWNDTIQAINGGVLDLSGLRTITVGINGQDDDLNLTVNSGGQINLDALQTIVAQGNGNELLRFNVGAGSTINAPSLLTARRVQFSMEAGSAFHAPSLLSLRNSTLTIQPGVTMTLTSLFDMRNSTLNVLDGGTLRIGAPLLAVDTTILVDDFGSELQLDRSLNMRGASAITITNGASLRVGGDLTHSTMLEANYQLDLAIVEFFGAGQRYLEVGGLDLGEVDPGNNGNFGIGRLEIGLDGSGTYVRLTDFLDNGNRQMGQLEAIYLFGLGGFDGLELGVGAVLNLGNLNAYAFMEGSWMRLNNLFTPGSSSVVALGDGHLILPSPASACLIALALACQSGRRRR